MCGIIGYIGAQSAAEILLDGLSNLEYRGYDSAGISLVQKDRPILTLKKQGRLQNLIDAYQREKEPSATCGIGHTRWATHGEPSDRNAHPHATEKLSLVHNGILENYSRLKTQMTAKGTSFTSDTDSEVIARLVDFYCKDNPFTAITEALKELEGSYALGILFAEEPDALYALRKDSPLIVGLGQDGNFIASDVSAILEYTRDYYLLEEGEIAVLRSDRVEVFDHEGNLLEKERLTADWTVGQAQKGGYPHFMRKEIDEQPGALRDTVLPRIKDSAPDFSGDGLPEDFFDRYQKVFFVACGTAMHAGALGGTLLEKLARISAEVDCASEFRYRNPIFPAGSLVVVISQSGETADTLAALRLAKARGVDTLAVVNVAGSTIAREADQALYTHAGPEIAVASTKAFSVQVALLYLLAFSFARAQKQIDDERLRSLTASLLAAIEKTPEAIGLGDGLAALAPRFRDTSSLFFMGRGLDYYLAMEGSLKLKEISYIHSESYAAGELKHGTISLITEGCPVVGLATQAELLPKTLSNLKEVRARGAYVLLITQGNAQLDEDVADEIVRLPAADELFLPLLAVIALQLLAYHVAVARGCDVDKPRNLAKSVTVE